jgi:hypothetical protein
MDREPKTKIPKPKVEPEVEKVVSPKRVMVATIIGILITGSVLWMISQLMQKVIDFTTAPVANNATSVHLPESGNPTQVLGDAKRNFTEMSFEEYIATGSAVRNVFDTLQNLQQSEVGIEDYFCNIFCK